MTYPLRWLRNAIIPGAEKPRPNTKPAADQLPAQEEALIESQHREKQRLDNSAKAALAKFLAGSERLQFEKPEAPLLSIVLVFYQQAHLSFLCLQSLLEYADVSYELIIVDNNSTDATTDLLDAIDGASVILNTENLGFVKAVNQAANAATGDYILLLNNDALIERDSLTNALAVIDGDDSVGADGAKIKLLDGSTQEAGSIIWKDGACLGYGRRKANQRYEYM